MPCNKGMANRTIAEQITALEARRDTLEAALTTATTSAATTSFTVDGQSFQAGVGINIKYLRDDLTRVEKSLQRLYRGGRGMPVDMSQAARGDTSADPYRSGSEVLL